MLLETRMRLIMFEEIYLESTQNLSLRIVVKIVETIANYPHLQISSFKIVPLVTEHELLR